MKEAFVFFVFVLLYCSCTKDREGISPYVQNDITTHYDTTLQNNHGTDTLNIDTTSTQNTNDSCLYIVWQPSSNNNCHYDGFSPIVLSYTLDQTLMTDTLSLDTYNVDNALLCGAEITNFQIIDCRGCSVCFSGPMGTDFVSCNSCEDIYLELRPL